MGAYLQLVTPGIRCWEPGSTRAVTTSPPTASSAPSSPTPTDAYRGAGRREATYAIERAMDALAGEFGIDPIDLRRRNFITEFPKIASGLTIDSGDYHASLEQALEQLDLDAVRAEQAGQARAGDVKQLGIEELSTYVEMCGLAPSGILGAIRYVAGGWDAATIAASRRRVQVLTGTTTGEGRDGLVADLPTSSATTSTRSRSHAATPRPARSG